MKHLDWMTWMLKGLGLLWFVLLLVFPIRFLNVSVTTFATKSEVVILNCEFDPIPNGTLIEIHLDGKLVESRAYSRESASVIWRLPSGDHMLKIIAEGYEMWQRRIHLLKGTSIQQVRVRFNKAGVD